MSGESNDHEFLARALWADYGLSGIFTAPEDRVINDVDIVISGSLLMPSRPRIGISVNSTLLTRSYSYFRRSAF